MKSKDPDSNNSEKKAINLEEIRIQRLRTTKNYLIYYVLTPLVCFLCIFLGVLNITIYKKVTFQKTPNKTTIYVPRNTDGYKILQNVIDTNPNSGLEMSDDGITSDIWFTRSSKVLGRHYRRYGQFNNWLSSIMGKNYSAQVDLEHEKSAGDVPENAFPPSHQAINYIPRMRVITNKGQLVETFEQYEKNKSIGVSYTDFHPETFNLGKKKDSKKFVEKILSNKKNPGVWTLKARGSSRGRGMYVVSEKDALELAIQLKDNYKDTFIYKNTELTRSKYVIQKYLEDPLLLNGRKFHVRAFFVVLSLNPLRVLLYQNGLVKPASLEYVKGDYDNTVIHLTNTHQQHVFHDKNDGNDGQIDIPSQLDFVMLNDYLREKNFIKEDENYIETNLLPSVEIILNHSIRAYYSRSSKIEPTSGIFFHFFGVDLLIDTKLKVWMTEIQNGPGMNLEDGVAKNMYFNIFDELVFILKRIQETGSKRNGKLNLGSEPELRNFKWLINDK